MKLQHVAPVEGSRNFEERAFNVLYRSHYSGYPIMANNVVWPEYGECDVLAVSSAGYIYEYEVKASRADFLAELRNKKEKHQKFRDGQGPNHFYFVTPHRTISAIDLPPGMGLIEINRDRAVIQVKSRRAHPEKLSRKNLIWMANRLTRRAYGSMMPIHCK